METDPKTSDTDRDCAIHEHPIPPKELSQYSVERDADAENDIASYLNGQAPDEIVHHVEKIKSEYVLGEEYEIWDATTDKSRWWVITNFTNLYSQKIFPSLDYTLSFHIGLMMRLKSRNHGPDGENPDPFDEVSRRQAQARDRFDRAIEPEDYQAVGMLLRECLLSLINAARRRIILEKIDENPQSANFIGWSNLIIGHLCLGERNKELRQYMKGASEKTWQLINWLTHNRSATKMHASIAFHGCDTIIGHFVNLIVGAENANIEKCPVCSSRLIRSHFDIEIGKDGNYYSTCGECHWSSHPGHDVAS